MRVALILTGKLEMLGLKTALERLFGREHDFVPLSRVRDEPTTPFHSFTSARQPVASNAEADSPLGRLVGAMIDAASSHDFDLSLVLDDLELCNSGNEAVVIAEFRAGVVRQLRRVAAQDAGAARALQDRLRTRASFHLVVPMIESWLFADPAGPRNAGVPEQRLPPPSLAGGDPEAFEVDDPSYMSDDGAHCTAWHALPQRYRQRRCPDWLGAVHPRERHPKRYFSWLCRSPAERYCSTYKEHTAATALANISWAEALSSPDRMLFMRAFLWDLADGLGCPPTGISLAGMQAAATSVQTRPAEAVLRNL